MGALLKHYLFKNTPMAIELLMYIHVNCKRELGK